MSSPCDLGERRGAGELAHQVHAFLGPADQQHVLLAHDVVGPRIEPPIHAAADGHHPHPRLRGEREVAERPSGARGVRADLHARGHLVGVTEVLAERVGDAEPRRDHARDVGRGVADPFDRVGDPQHAGHALGVLGAARGEHRHDAEAPQVPVHPLFQAADLSGQLLLVEEHRRVRQVDHELGGVLQLDEELFDVPGFVIHVRSRREEG